jgi:hypothetical protein
MTTATASRLLAVCALLLAAGAPGRADAQGPVGPAPGATAPTAPGRTEAVPPPQSRPDGHTEDPDAPQANEEAPSAPPQGCPNPGRQLQLIV